MCRKGTRFNLEVVIMLRLQRLLKKLECKTAILHSKEVQPKLSHAKLITQFTEVKLKHHGLRKSNNEHNFITNVILCDQEKPNMIQAITKTKIRDSTTLVRS